jgi:hypothetical protein
MSRSTLWIVLPTVALLASHLPGCGRPDARRYPRQVAGTTTDAGKASGTGGMEPEPEPTATGGSGTGGRAGSGTGGAEETGGAGGGGAPGSGGIFGDTLDAAPATGGAGGALEPDAAASPDLPGTGGATGGTGGVPGTGGQGGRDAGVAIPGDGTTAYCYPDPNVIAICKQLEPACLNCPSNSTRCFNVAAAGDDRACARYAVDNNCKVDVGGNWCGSLNCMAQGCDKAACRTLQGEGNSPMCQKMLTQCPCK